MRYPYLRDDPSNPVDIEVVDSGLQFVNPGGPSKLIEWRDIRQVRLCCELNTASRLLEFERLMFCCVISSRRRNDIVLTHLRREAGAIVNDSAAYQTFIVELHQRMMANAPRRISLRVGRSWWWVLGQTLWASMCSNPPWIGLALLLGPVLFARRDHTMPPEIQVVRRNLPLRYHPAYLPERVLPSMETA